MAKEKIASSVMLAPKTTFIASLANMKREEWQKDENSDYRLVGEVNVEGVVQDTCADPWAEWMKKKLFLSLYLPKKDVSWYSIPGKVVSSLARALGVSVGEFESDPSKFDGSSVCVFVKHTGGQYRVNKKTGLKEWNPLQEEIAYFEPAEIANME